MNRKAQPVTLVVDNPYFSADHPESQSNPRSVAAVVNLRESSIISLASHGVIDADQVAAAWRFRRAWETVQSTGGASSGFQEWMDSGCRSTEIAEKRLVAAGDLRLAKRRLGDHGYDLVARICGDGFHIRDLYRTRRARDTMTDMLRIYLTILAQRWH